MHELIASITNSQTFLADLPEIAPIFIFIAVGAVALTFALPCFGIGLCLFRKKSMCTYAGQIGPMDVGGWHGWPRNSSNTFAI